MYYLLLFFLYPLALLPMPALYVASDIMYLLAYHVFGYRKGVVMDNLRHAFPEKTEEELQAISKRFYRNFCDQWLETIKLLTISEQELNKRIQGNWEVFEQLHAEGRNTYALLGHMFNWEWANVACQYNSKQQFAGVYMPVSNKAFDRLLYRMRSKGGGWLISMKAKKAFQRLEGVQYIVGLIADQNPSNMPSSVWHSFMHREVPFYKGPEQLARRAKAAVVFAAIEKLRRGYYRVTLHRIADDASQLAEGEVIRRYVQFMEEQLRKQPENWMWTHKRWKNVRAKEQ